jgi:hypothetical protein
MQVAEGESSKGDVASDRRGFCRVRFVDVQLSIA